jgi:hypothetical protein
MATYICKSCQGITVKGRPICSRCAPSVVPATSCPRCQAVFRGAGRVCGSCSDFLRSGASAFQAGRSCSLPPKGKERPGKAPKRGKCIQCGRVTKGSLPRCQKCYRAVFLNRQKAEEVRLRAQARAEASRELKASKDLVRARRVEYLRDGCWADLVLDGRTRAQCCFGRCMAPHKGNGFCPGHQPPAKHLKAAVALAKEILQKREGDGPVAG